LVCINDIYLPDSITQFYLYSPQINSSYTYQPVRSIFSYYPVNKAFFNHSLSKIGPIVEVSVMFSQVLVMVAPVLVALIAVIQKI